MNSDFILGIALGGTSGFIFGTVLLIMLFRDALTAVFRHGGIEADFGRHLKIELETKQAVEFEKEMEARPTHERKVFDL